MLSKQTQEKIDLYEKMMQGKATSRELVRLSFLRGMITSEDYDDFLQIEKDCEGKED
jgi:hypothetical protein